MNKSVTFITVSDISGSSGHNVATKEVVRTLCNRKGVDLKLILPKPGNDSVSHILSKVQETHYLPEKSGNKHLWHVSVQPFLFEKTLRCRNSDIIISRVAPSMLPPALVARWTNAQYVLLVRGISSWGPEKSGSIPQIYRSVLRLNADSSDKIVIAYGEIETAMNELGVDTSAVVTFPNAVDPDTFYSIPKEQARNKTNLSFSSDSLVVGFVGSFNERHKLVPLMKSIKSCIQDGVDVSGLFVGNGPQKKELEKMVREFPAQTNIEFTGVVPHKSVPSYVSSCDILYGVTSSGDPSNPIKIYEYLACERPVITSQTPELSFVGSIEAGILLDEVSPAEISNAIKQFAALDQKERQNMGQRGRNYVINKHTWDNFINICLN